MRFAPVLSLALLLATPAFATPGVHDGSISARTGPELSDVALFVMAVAGVILARRAMRGRSRRD